jgi:hypothetical protein
MRYGEIRLDRKSVGLLRLSERSQSKKETLAVFSMNFRNVTIVRKVKVKLSLYRPWRPSGLREVEAPTFSDIRLTDGGKVVSPTRRPLFTPRKIPGTHFC